MQRGTEVLYQLALEAAETVYTFVGEGGEEEEETHILEGIGLEDKDMGYGAGGKRGVENEDWMVGGARGEDSATTSVPFAGLKLEQGLLHLLDLFY